MNTHSDFLNKISELQHNYYANNKKNILFKEKQKQDCALSITRQLSLNELLEHSIFILPNSYKIFIDYKLFKTFAEPSINNSILQHIMNLTIYCINTYNTYEVHIDLSGFTISSAQRYKSMIQLYNASCLQSDTRFSAILKIMHVYNVPTIIDNIATILNPFIDNTVKTKIILHSKSESPGLLALLLQ